jgi:hypothetical protein
MVRAAMMDSIPAAEAGAPLQLENLAWGRPLVAGPRSLNMALLRHGDGLVKFEIYSLGAEAGDEIVHCQGQARFASGAADTIDVEHLKRRMARDAGSDSAYRADGELLVPVGSLGGATALADALFRAVALLTGSAARRPLHPALPFALDALCIGPDAARAAFAWARQADSGPAHDAIRIDVDLCDEQGAVIVQMRGLAFDAVRAAAPVTAPVAARPAIVLDDPVVHGAAAPAARAPVLITLD